MFNLETGAEGRREREGVRQQSWGVDGGRDGECAESVFDQRFPLFFIYSPTVIKEVQQMRGKTMGW